VISGVFIAEEVDGVRGKGSGYTMAVDVQTVLEGFFKHVPEIFSLMRLCYGKKQNFQDWDYFP
jgi:hypothetical protein